MTPDQNRKPTLVLVTGRPGSGKTTLARALADTLSCPLLSRDEMYEGMLRTLAPDLQPSDKDQVKRATFDLFFRVMGTLVSSNVTLVAEAAFQDERWRIGLEPIVSSTELKVIYCVVPAELARRRILQRRSERHKVSRVVRAGIDDRLADEQGPVAGPFVALSLPVPMLRVATVDGFDPPLDELVAFLTS